MPVMQALITALRSLSGIPGVLSEIGELDLELFSENFVVAGRIEAKWAMFPFLYSCDDFRTRAPGDPFGGASDAGSAMEALDRASVRGRGQGQRARMPGGLARSAPVFTSVPASASHSVKRSSVSRGTVSSVEFDVQSPIRGGRPRGRSMYIRKGARGYVPGQKTMNEYGLALLSGEVDMDAFDDDDAEQGTAITRAAPAAAAAPRMPTAPIPAGDGTVPGAIAIQRDAQAQPKRQKAIAVCMCVCVCVCVACLCVCVCVCVCVHVCVSVYE
jgi:hypothetical protein